jgi:hypothetical protein
MPAALRCGGSQSLGRSGSNGMKPSFALRRCAGDGSRSAVAGPGPGRSVRLKIHICLSHEADSTVAVQFDSVASEGGPPSGSMATCQFSVDEYAVTVWVWRAVP